MALVLVMFLGLHEVELHEASRNNITICKGIQTCNASLFQWPGSFPHLVQRDRDVTLVFHKHFKSLSCCFAFKTSTDGKLPNCKQGYPVFKN